MVVSSASHTFSVYLPEATALRSTTGLSEENSPRATSFFSSASVSVYAQRASTVCSSILSTLTSSFVVVEALTEASLSDKPSFEPMQTVSDIDCVSPAGDVASTVMLKRPYFFPSRIVCGTSTVHVPSTAVVVVVV